MEFDLAIIDKIGTKLYGWGYGGYASEKNPNFDFAINHLKEGGLILYEGNFSYKDQLSEAWDGPVLCTMCDCEYKSKPTPDDGEVFTSKKIFVGAYYYIEHKIKIGALLFNTVDGDFIPRDICEIAYSLPTLLQRSNNKTIWRIKEKYELRIDCEGFEKKRMVFDTEGEASYELMNMI